MPPARTAPSRACSTASIRRAARSPRSSSRRPTNSTTISCGAARSRCRSAAASASSTAPITRNAWWCGCIRKSSPRRRFPPRLVTRNIWRERFEDISAFEHYLARNGTVILKFFLNVSKQEQRERFLDRLDEPAKNWKFSMADISERALWAQIPGRLSGDDPAHLEPGRAMVRGAGRSQMVCPRGDRLGHRQRAGRARPEISRRSMPPRWRNSSRCARRWRTKARAV